MDHASAVRYILISTDGGELIARLQWVPSMRPPTSATTSNTGMPGCVATYMGLQQVARRGAQAHALSGPPSLPTLVATIPLCGGARASCMVHGSHADVAVVGVPRAGCEAQAPPVSILRPCFGAHASCMATESAAHFWQLPGIRGSRPSRGTRHAVCC